MASPKCGQASCADSFVPGTIPARSASASGSSTSMTLNYSRGLGLTVEDIAVLRTGTCKAWRAGVNPAQHRIVDARTSRYAETDARWQRDPERIDDALRAKGVSA